MNMRQAAEITSQLRRATAALSQAQGDFPAPAIEQLDVATRETVAAIFRAREALRLPGISDPEMRRSVSNEAVGHPRLASRAEATRRTKADRIAKDNEASFQKMKLRPRRDSVQKLQMSADDIA
jgi:hypothetical protein